MRISSENHDKEILKIIENVIPGCSEIYLRSAYFYFSGFSLIAKALAKNPNIKIKVLVGLESDSKTFNLVNQSARRKEYLNKFTHEVLEKDILDNREEEEAYFIFKKKLFDGTLEIRQRDSEDHSKEYIFKYNSKISKTINSKGQVFIGSFNFSKSGLETRTEVSTILRDDNSFNDATKDFNKFWETSIPLLDKNSINEFKKITEKFPFEQKPNPYLLFIKVLDEYFKDLSTSKIRLPKDITDGFFGNFKYQKDAILRGIEILNEHNGVLISDVVGLGKSIIASAIANNLGLRTIVITPPHLEQQWKDYLNIFQTPGSKIYTSGRISDALNDNSPGQKLIIVDEVHKFRNDETKDYLDLYQLCHGSYEGKSNKIILLSATPFNNKPKDTFSLIKLFQIPTKSSLQTITNLSEYFELLSKKYNSLEREQRTGKRSKNELDKEFKNLGSEIRKIITPLIIRRSRIDLKLIKAYDEDLKKQGISFPKVKDPILLEYKLGNLEKIYEETLAIISPSNKKSNYKCARYKPLTYIKEEFLNEVLMQGGYLNDDKKGKLPSEQQNIHDFIKRMMVRRFESSIPSFLLTLQHVIDSNKRVIKFYENKNVVPIFPRHQLPDYEDLFGDVDSTDDKFDLQILDNQEIDKFKNKGGWFVKKKQLSSSYIKDVKSDLEILEKIKKKWDDIYKSSYKDPKIDEFKKILENQLKSDKKRKIIVFSEFSDTANYLFNNIKKEFKCFLYTSKQSTNKKIKDEIKNNFDASVILNKQKNDYDILIATDAISEGFNLHRAGTIFNYDIPYNPTRVVQRFGRINRINKKVFNELYIFNYFPTEIGEREVGISRITGLKKLMFNSIFGEDTKVLKNNEDLVSYFQEKFNELYNENESPETYFENLIYDVREHNPQDILLSNEIAKKVKIKRINHKKKGIIVFSKKGSIPRFIFSDQNKEIQNISPLEAFRIFEAKKNEKSILFDKKYDKVYENIKSKIFAAKKITPYNKKKKDLVNKLESLSSKSIYQKYYFDMFRVVKDLDALTPRQLKVISKKLTQSNCDKNIKEIESIIPHNLLKSLLKTYDDIQLKKDTLIISEQLND